MLRGFVFLALVSGAGYGAWNFFPDSSLSALNWAKAEAQDMMCETGELRVELPEKQADAIAQPVAFQTLVQVPDDRFLISKETLAAITCGPWDISEEGMEAILQEMIRRGWTPPSGARALEASQYKGDLIAAVDPEADASPPAEGR